MIGIFSPYTRLPAACFFVCVGVCSLLTQKKEYSYNIERNGRESEVCVGGKKKRNRERWLHLLLHVACCLGNMCVCGMYVMVGTRVSIVMVFVVFLYYVSLLI